MVESPCGAGRGAGEGHGTHDALASWVGELDAPGPEAARARLMARTGGVAAVVALAVYLTWRIGWTLPANSYDRRDAWTLIAVEALPLLGLIVKTVTLWSIDTVAPVHVKQAPNGMRVALLDPNSHDAD